MNIQRMMLVALVALAACAAAASAQRYAGESLTATIAGTGSQDGEYVFEFSFESGARDYYAFASGPEGGSYTESGINVFEASADGILYDAFTDAFLSFNADFDGSQFSNYTSSGEGGYSGANVSLGFTPPAVPEPSSTMLLSSLSSLLLLRRGSRSSSRR